MEWFSKNKVAVAGIALAILSAVLRFLAADQTQHPTGWDGYYYVMQVHSWINYGYLQSPDFSLIYPYLTMVTIIAGDVILGFKTGVALLSGLLVGAVFYSLNKRAVPLSWICIVCAYIVFSPLTTYFVLQFPKNALGLIFLVICLSSSNRVVMVLFFVATIMTHRMTGAFALISGGLFALRHVSWKWISIGAVIVVAISFLPGVLHFSDVERLKGQLTFIPHWPPFSFYRLFPDSLSWAYQLDLVLISVLIPVSFFLVIRHRKNISFSSWMWLPIAAISIFPFFKFSAGDLGYRFFLVAPIVLFMMLPYGNWRPRVVWIAAVIVLSASVISFHSYRPRSFDPPNDRYSYIVGKLITRYDPQEYPLVIAHNSLAEMIIFRTDFDALNWLPPEDMQPQHILRLIQGVNYADLRKYLDAHDSANLRPIASGYFALPEDGWQRFVAAATRENDPRVMASIFSQSNPMNKRPYYLNKGKIR